MPLVESPGELLGLPSGFPSLAADLGGLRLVLISIGATWAVALGRRRQALAVALAVLFTSCALGFWALVLERPYGVLQDAVATRRAAEVSVAAAGGTAVGSFVAGAPAGALVWRALVAAGLPAAWVNVLPTLMPIAVLAAATLAIALLWRGATPAVYGASLFAAFNTSELLVLRGMGLAPGLWERPESGCLFALVLAAALGLARVSRSAPASVALASLPCALGLVSVGSERLGWPDALFAVSVDQGAWLAALLVARKRLDPAAAGLCIGGTALTLAGAFGAADPWLGLALLRCGVLLAAGAALKLLAESLARHPRLGGLARDPRAREARVAGLAFALVLPGSFSLRHDAIAIDPTAERSLEALSPNLEPAMRYVRSQTPRDAVFLASPAYSATVAVRGGRRVLRAQGLVETADDVERVRAERPLLMRRPVPERHRRWRVGYAFVAPGDFQARGVRSPESLVGRDGLELLYADAHGFHVYRLHLEGTPTRSRQ